LTRIATEPSPRAATAARPPGDLATLAVRHGLTVGGTRPPLAEYVRRLWVRRQFIATFSTARLTAQYSQARHRRQRRHRRPAHVARGERDLDERPDGGAQRRARLPCFRHVSRGGEGAVRRHRCVFRNQRQRRESCERAIWLEQGLILSDGETDGFIDAYEARHDPKALAERLSAARGLAAARGCG
jgi:hypothetical protein